jgi:hypothetical protein
MVNDGGLESVIKRFVRRHAAVGAATFTATMSSRLRNRSRGRLAVTTRPNNCLKAEFHSDTPSLCVAPSFASVTFNMRFQGFELQWNGYGKLCITVLMESGWLWKVTVKKHFVCRA